jgi:hypothetical protein
MPAIAVKSPPPAPSLIGWVSPPLPARPGDPGAASLQTAAIAESGTLPITGLDLAGVAEVSAGFLIAGGGALLASRRMGKGQRKS